MVLLKRRTSCENWEAKSVSNIGKCYRKTCSRILKTIFLPSFISIFVITLLFGDFWFPSGFVDAVNLTELVVPDNKSLSDFNNHCKTSPEYGYFYLTEAIVKDMHFDYCREIHPVFSLPQQNVGGNDSLTLRINFTLNNIVNDSQKDLNITRQLTCADIKNLYDTESTIKESYESFDDILDRSSVCTLPKDELIHINCSSCKDSYKEWLCMAYLKYSFNNEPLEPCQSLAGNVCLNCPAIEQSESYGGYSIFTCHNADDTMDISMDICPTTASNSTKCASFSCLPAYNQTFV